MVKLRCGLRTILWMTLIMGLSWFPVVWADLNDGLVAYYPFDGNANDASGNENHGTVFGATLTEDRFENTDSAYSFNGVSNYIRVADTPSLSGFPAITLSAWFYKGELQDTLEGIVTKWFQLSANETIREQDTYGMSILRDRIHGFTNNHCCQTANGNFPMEQWVYATFIHTTDEGGKIYINGQLVGQLNVTGVITNSTNPVIIGADNNRGQIWRFFKGKLDDVRIYNRALPECEIKSLYTGDDECKQNLVTLNNFTATPFQNDIRVHWVTASEVDNAGFHLWCAIGGGWKTGDYSQVIRITDQLISSKGNKVGGYPYSYIDSNLESGITYYYGLEDIDFNGQSTVHWDFIDKATAK